MNNYNDQLTDIVYHHPSVRSIELALHDGQFLTDALAGIKLSRLNIIMDRMGGGKTVACRKFADKVRTMKYVAAEKCLVRGAAAAFGAESYKTCRPDAPRVATTINSLWKLDSGEGKTDLLILDELPFIVDNFFNETADKSGGGRSMCESLMRHMKCAGRIIAPSADHTPAGVQALIHAAGAVGITDIAVIVTRRPQSGPRRTVELYRPTRMDDLWAADVRDHVSGGPPLAIATSRGSADDIEAKVLSMRPDLAGRILKISSENSTEDWVVELLANTDRITREYDILIFTPAVRSGVSIDGLVRRVYIDAFGCLSVASVLQGAGRFRAVEDPTIRATLTVEPKPYLTTDPDALRALARSETASRGALVPLRCVAWDLDSHPDARKPDSRVDGVLLDWWHAAETQLRRENNDRCGEFIRLAGGHGWDVVDLRDEVVEDERKAYLAQLRKDGKALRKAMWLKEVTEGTTARSKRYDRTLRKYYGTTTLTADMICGSPKEADKQMKSLDELIIVSELGLLNPQLARVRGCEPRARLLLGALTASGVDIAMGGYLDKEALGQWLEEDGRLQALQNIMGKYQADRLGPMVVRALGGIVKERETSRDGKSVMRKWADFSDALKLAAHQRKIMISGDCA